MPKIAPVVPMPESLPTTVPVCARLVSRSLVTIGVTAASSAPGTKIAAVATSISAAPPTVSAAPRTTNGVAATATPEMPSSGPRARRGSIVSAA